MALKFKSKVTQAARLKVNILKTVNDFHWKAKDNLSLTPEILVIVFRKGGRYIITLGLGTFLSIVCMGLSIKVICEYQHSVLRNELA